MNPVKEFVVGARMKAAGINDLPFPVHGSGMWTVRPRSRVNLRKVGDGLSNSASSAVVTSLGTAYSEPTLREYERSEGQWEIVEDSPAAELVNDPNPFIETELMWTYEVAAIAATGNAFYHIVRNLIGEPIQLWPLYPAFMKPHTPRNGDQFLSHWTYTIPGGQEQQVPTQDLIHRRWGLNRHDFRLGYAPLAEVLLEILQDDEAAKFSTSLLHNLGVPGVILSPKDINDPGPADPEAVSTMFQRKFTGENRGRPFVSSNALQVDMVSFNPKQMDLTNLRRVPEERISAALGWPAILAGLGAGLSATSGRGESSTLREFATEQRLVPMWKLAGKQWTRQLLRDEAYGEPSTKRQLRFDLTEVRALQKDEDDMVNRLDTAIQGGWATVAEGRRAINLPTSDEHDVFLRSVATMAIGIEDDATEVFDAGAEGNGSGSA